MVPSDRDEVERRFEEWSIVRFDGRRETIAMRLDASRTFERAALILPVPARASFALGDVQAFGAIEARTRPRVETRKRWSLFGGGGGDDESPDRAVGGAEGVEVVGAQDLGPLRVVTLAAGDGGLVETWLEDHGFPAPEGTAAAAQRYLDRGWLLVAARLRGRGGEPVRSLQPLVVSFPTATAVYPMMAPAPARVDVIAREPVAVRGRAGHERVFAGPLPGARYLTSYRFAAGQGGDAEFVPADRDDFRQVRFVYEDAALWPFALGGLLLLALAGAAGGRLVSRNRTTGFR